MGELWLWLLPLLYLPNVGGGVATPFGVLEISDFAILPYLLATLLAPRRPGLLLARNLKGYGLLFAAWTSIGTLLMYFYYQKGQPEKLLLFSLLKVGKFALYAYAGLRTAELLNSTRLREKLNWSLLGAGVLTSLALIYLVFTANLESLQSIKQSAAAAEAFKSSNQVSATLSMLLCYLSAIWLADGGTSVWRKGFPVLALVMLIGFASSGGRGGMVAAAAGLIYAFLQRGITFKTGMTAIILASAPFALYQYNPAFRLEVDRTFNSDPEKMAKYREGVLGINEGARLSTWLNEGSKVIDAPIFGVGFFNRSRETGLWDTGSHNFWLQMFLDTGLIGGSLVLLMFFRMWWDAGGQAIRGARLSLPVRSALVAAFVSGLSGEYFYGGMCLFTLLTIYSIAGSFRRGEI